ncbi:MAG: ABC transporter substrate-binding protein [Magnetospirillum sp.]|nr:ABC transporter substrate-binding protein [Magnetospirillum sp.]
MMSRRLVLVAAAAVLSLSLVRPALTADASTDPKAFVGRLADQALQTMLVKGLSDQERTQKFRELFVAAVDMPEISRFVLGRYWRSASAEQQQEFIRLFEDILVYTWAPRFKDYAVSINHEVVTVTPDGERGVLVESLVKRERQDPIKLMWRLRQPDGGYKVVDLAVANTWMAFTYRQEYGSVVSNQGGRIDGLLDAMRRKIAQLQADPNSARMN